jgi:hypothetical protein
VATAAIPEEDALEEERLAELDGDAAAADDGFRPA